VALELTEYLTKNPAVRPAPGGPLAVSSAVARIAKPEVRRMAVRDLPDVANFEGFLFSHPGTIDPSEGVLRLQYTGPCGTRFELQVPALAALKMLTLLEQWSRDQVLDHLREPVGSIH
jgi:hypothetical protein